MFLIYIQGYKSLVKEILLKKIDKYIQALFYFQNMEQNQSKTGSKTLKIAQSN